MRDITKIDFNRSYGRVRTMDAAKQKCFYIQDGIEYDSSGTACNAKQVKEHYAQVAASLQQQADEAKEQAAAAQAQADEMLKAAGVTKAQARKAS
jgi:hypothetical protein